MKEKDGEYTISVSGDPKDQKIIWEKLYYVTLQQFAKMSIMVRNEAKEYKTIKFKFYFTIFIVCWFIGTFIAGVYKFIPNLFTNFYVNMIFNSLCYGLVLLILFIIVKKIYFYRNSITMKKEIEELKKSGKDKELLDKFLDFLSKFRFTKSKKKFFQFLKSLEDNNLLITNSIKACTQMILVNVFHFNREDGGIGQETWEEYQKTVQYLKEKSPEAYYKLFCEAEEELKKIVTVYNSDSEEYKRVFKIMSENVSIKLLIITKAIEGLLTTEIFEESDVYIVFKEGVDPSEVEKEGWSEDIYVNKCEFISGADLSDDRFVICFNTNKDKK